MIENRRGIAIAIRELLLRLYPRGFRKRTAEDFRTAFDACVARERRRGGVGAAALALCVLTLDSARAAAALRLREHRLRDLVDRHATPRPPGGPLVSSLWQDAKYAVRGMRRSPGFSLVVIATLAIAIGANTAMFGIVNAVLLRALPYRDADRLVMVYEAIPKAIPGPIGFSAPDYVAFEARTTSFESVAAFRNKTFELSGVDQPERITAAVVSGSFFATLGVSPAIGMPFSREDDESRRPVAVLTDGLWRRSFGADPGVIGRAVMLDRTPYTILGVMPRGFTFPNRGPQFNNIPAELYLPIAFTDRERAAFGSMYNNSVVARLKPGVTAQQADAEAKAIIAAQSAEMYPAFLADLAKGFQRP